MNRWVRSLDSATRPVLLCFSHLHWDFVFQRPQHLMTRAAAGHQVFYIEEPEHAVGPAHFRIRTVECGVTVLRPVLDFAFDRTTVERRLLSGIVAMLGARKFVHWFYTPLALPLTEGLPCDVCVYDCMDELSNFRFAPANLPEQERALMRKADFVFTGGRSLFAAKRDLHPSVHLYPSSVDAEHFGSARGTLADPADQASIAQPRVGFFGVIDERMDLALVAQAADALPQVQFVMLGPLAKVQEADLPRAANLHWLGRKSYTELPAYLSNWRAGWMPFALNDATRFISPTKTPEFLAAGLPVVSTAVPDVVTDYGQTGLVRIADREGIVRALESVLIGARPGWLAKVDTKLSNMSWDATWGSMQTRVQAWHLLSAEMANA